MQRSSLVQKVSRNWHLPPVYLKMDNNNKEIKENNGFSPPHLKSTDPVPLLSSLCTSSLTCTRSRGIMDCLEIKRNVLLHPIRKW